MSSPFPTDPVLCASLAVHEMLRRIDVPSEQIFIGANAPDGKVQVHVHTDLHGRCVDGGCRLVVDIGTTDDAASFGDRWAALVEQFNRRDYDRKAFTKIYQHTLAAIGGGTALTTLALNRRIGRFKNEKVTITPLGIVTDRAIN